MFNRRMFAGGALGAALCARAVSRVVTPDDAAAIVERVRSFYGSLKTFADVASTATSLLGMENPGEVRTAFAAPGKLCMQLSMHGNILLCFIVDGESRWHWDSKGWREYPSVQTILAGLKGAGSAIGPYPWCLAALLLDKQLDGAVGLRSLRDSRCTWTSKRCTRLEGMIEDIPTDLELADSGALETVRAHEKLQTFEIFTTARAAPTSNPKLDLDALIAAVRRDPGRPMQIPHH